MKLISDFTVSARPIRMTGSRSPAAAFGQGEDGCWLDPSVLSSLFEDTAGSTPAVVGGRVGRVEDLSGNGHHAIQADSWARPYLGRHPHSGLRNFKADSENYAAWSTSGATKTLEPTGARDGGPAVRVVAPTSGSYVNAGTTYHRSFVGKPVTISVEVKSVTANGVRIFLGGASNNFSAVFDFTSEIFANVDNRISATSALDLGDGWWRIGVTTSDLANATAVLLRSTHDNAEFVAAYMQAEPGAGMTTYQTVDSAYDVSQPGQKPVYYLCFDGVDDAMQSSLTGLGRDDIAAAFWCSYAPHGGTGYVLNASGNETSEASRSFSVLYSDATGGTELRVGGDDGENLAAAALTQHCVSAAWDRVGDTGTVLWDRAGAQPMAIGAVAQDLPLRLGARETGAYFSGRVYGLVARLTATDPGTLAGIRSHLCNQAGVNAG